MCLCEEEPEPEQQDEENSLSAGLGSGRCLGGRDLQISLLREKKFPRLSLEFPCIRRGGVYRAKVSFLGIPADLGSPRGLPGGDPKAHRSAGAEPLFC